LENTGDDGDDDGESDDDDDDDDDDDASMDAIADDVNTDEVALVEGVEIGMKLIKAKKTPHEATIATMRACRAAGGSITAQSEAALQVVSYAQVCSEGCFDNDDEDDEIKEAIQVISKESSLP